MEQTWWEAARSHASAFVEDRRREYFLDLQQLPVQVRWLAHLGYGAVLVMLLAVLFFDLLGLRTAQSPLEAALGDGNGITTVNVPLGVLFVSSLALALGWALILTGASHRWWLFIPIATLFLFQLFFSASWESSAGGTIGCLVILAVMGFSGLSVIVRGFRARHEWVLAEFALWMGILIVQIGGVWIWGREMAARSLYQSLDFWVLFVALPFWFWLGVDAVNAAIDLIRPLMTTLRRALSEERLLQLVPLFLLGRLGISFVLTEASPLGFFDFFFTVPLLLAAPVLWVVREQYPRVVLGVLWLALTSFAFSFFITLASLGTDVNTLALSSTRLFPPVLIFALLVLYDVSGFGKRFAESEGSWVPRAGRVLMYLGVVLVFMSITLLNLNLRDPVTGLPDGTYQDISGTIAALSMLGFGPPMLLWLTWQGREAALAPPAIAETEKPDPTP